MLDSDHWANELPELKGVKFRCVDEVDIGVPYTFDAVAVLEDEQGRFHVVSTSGCSCPSHEERAQYDSGPHLSYEEAKNFVPESHRSQFK